MRPSSIYVFPSFYGHGFENQNVLSSLNTLLGLRGNIKSFIFIRNGKVHDVNIHDELVQDAGSIYIMRFFDVGTPLVAPRLFIPLLVHGIVCLSFSIWVPPVLWFVFVKAHYNKIPRLFSNYSLILVQDSKNNFFPLRILGRSMLNN